MQISKETVNAFADGNIEAIKEYQNNLTLGYFNSDVGQKEQTSYMLVSMSLTQMMIKETELPAIATIEVMLKNHEYLVKMMPKLGLVVKTLKLTIPLDRVGWNDYFMAKWMLDRDEAALDEIIKRYYFKEGGNHPIFETCRWMVNSMMQQNEVFRIQFKVRSQELGYGEQAGVE